MKRTIAVVTSSRADYSHLYWPLHDLAQHPDVDMKLIVLGAHLAPQFGETVKEIENDGFPIAARLECLLSSDTDVGMAKTLGVAVLALADLLGQMRPDLLLLIADRYEMLAPASVALTLRIPIAHIEGGEISEGAIDDAVRNALTKMSHIHFTSTEGARARVVAMGEEPWRVHRAGAPSLDHLRRSRLLGVTELQERLQINLQRPTVNLQRPTVNLQRPTVNLQRPTVVVAYHPVTIVRDTTQEADSLFAALRDVDAQILFCYPNADAGSHALMQRTRDFLATRSDARVYVNLEAVTYWSLLRHVALLIGNSSSGIMEAASLALPSVNVGFRQKGRERARNVLDAAPEATAILDAIAEAMSDEFRASLAGMTNPYGDGHAAEKIVQVLTTSPLSEELLVKHTPAVRS